MESSFINNINNNVVVVVFVVAVTVYDLMRQMNYIFDYYIINHNILFLGPNIYYILPLGDDKVPPKNLINKSSMEHPLICINT